MPNPKDHKHGLVHILVHTLVLLLHFPYLTIPYNTHLDISRDHRDRRDRLLQTTLLNFESDRRAKNL